jgi:hypothetical protein
MRQGNLFVMGVDIWFASVTVSAGKAVVVSSSQQRHSHQQMEEWVFEWERCWVECACVEDWAGMQQRRAIA